MIAKNPHSTRQFQISVGFVTKETVHLFKNPTEN